MIEAYPLCWPSGYPRTKNPMDSAFGKHSFARVRDELLHELNLMGATRVILSTNIPLRKDGIPYSNMAQPKDCGVAVYFFWKDQQRVLACDKWRTIENNLRALTLAISAMRGLSRWGVSQIMDRVFQGFTALPEPEKKSWRRVFGVQFRDKPLTREEVEKMYKEGMRASHPDMGGSHERAADLNWAIQEARKELK